MEKLVIKKVVLDIMTKDRKARNDDYYLYRKVIQKYNKGALELPFGYMLDNITMMGLPDMATVSRWRRKHQEDFPQLRADVGVRAKREKLRKQYKEMVIR